MLVLLPSREKSLALEFMVQPMDFSGNIARHSGASFIINSFRYPLRIQISICPHSFQIQLFKCYLLLPLSQNLWNPSTATPLLEANSNMLKAGSRTPGHFIEQVIRETQLAQFWILLTCYELLICYSCPLITTTSINPIDWGRKSKMQLESYDH